MDLEARAHDQVLVLRCQADDRDAFSCLYARYHGPLKYYLRRLLDSPQTADDVLQTVWLKALTGIKQLRNTELFRAWLYAHNPNGGKLQSIELVSMAETGKM